MTTLIDREVVELVLINVFVWTALTLDILGIW